MPLSSRSVAPQPPAPSIYDSLLWFRGKYFLYVLCSAHGGSASIQFSTVQGLWATFKSVSIFVGL